MIERRARDAGDWGRKPLFGDWRPLLRDPLDVPRLSFAKAANVFLLASSLENVVRVARTFSLLVAAAPGGRRARPRSGIKTA